MLEAGTTTLEIKSGYGLRLEHELKILRVISQLKRHHPCKIIATFLGAHAVPAGVIPEEYARIVVEEMIPAVHQEGLTEFCDVYCENGSFNPDLSKKILRTGTTNGCSRGFKRAPYEGGRDYSRNYDQCGQSIGPSAEHRKHRKRQKCGYRHSKSPKSEVDRLHVRGGNS